MSGEIAQSDKCLPGKHADLQHSAEKARHGSTHVVGNASNPSAGEDETGGSLGLSGPSRNLSQGTR